MKESSTQTTDPQMKTEAQKFRSTQPLLVLVEAEEIQSAQVLLVLVVAEESQSA